MYSLLRPEVCTVVADIELFDKDLDEDGATVTLYQGTIKGHFQQTIKQLINNNERTQAKVGIYLTPAESIPEEYEYCGGVLRIGTKEYLITDVVANYGINGKLNYWTIKTE